MVVTFSRELLHGCIYNDDDVCYHMEMVLICILFLAFGLCAASGDDTLSSAPFVYRFGSARPEDNYAGPVFVAPEGRKVHISLEHSKKAGFGRALICNWRKTDFEGGQSICSEVLTFQTQYGLTPHESALTQIRYDGEKTDTRAQVYDFLPSDESETARVTLAPPKPPSIDWEPAVSPLFVTRPSTFWMCACDGTSFTYTRFLLCSSTDGWSSFFSFEIPLGTLYKGKVYWGKINMKNHSIFKHDGSGTFDYSQDMSWQVTQNNKTV